MNPDSMKIIGLTGGIASGKSTVSHILQELNDRHQLGTVPLVIVDADLIARRALDPGTAPYRRVVAEFGSRILNEQDGTTINRDKLGEIVFSDPVARRKINAATHRFILMRMLWEIVRTLIQYRNRVIIVLDVPLLFETKILARFCHKVIVVHVDQQLQLQRLMQRNNLDEQAALQRIQAQMSLDKKRDLADIVINNNGSIQETRAQIERIFEQLQHLERSSCVAQFVLISAVVLVLLAVPSLLILRRLIS